MPRMWKKKNQETVWGLGQDFRLSLFPQLGWVIGLMSPHLRCVFIEQSWKCSFSFLVERKIICSTLTCEAGYRCDVFCGSQRTFLRCNGVESLTLESILYAWILFYFCRWWTVVSCSLKRDWKINEFTFLVPTFFNLRLYMDLKLNLKIDLCICLFNVVSLK